MPNSTPASSTCDTWSCDLAVDMHPLAGVSCMAHGSAARLPTASGMRWRIPLYVRRVGLQDSPCSLYPSSKPSVSQKTPLSATHTPSSGPPTPTTRAPRTRTASTLSSKRARLSSSHQTVSRASAATATPSSCPTAYGSRPMQSSSPRASSRPGARCLIVSLHSCEVRLQAHCALQLLR